MAISLLLQKEKRANNTGLTVKQHKGKKLKKGAKPPDYWLMRACYLLKMCISGLTCFSTGSDS